jgi:hypothetical protein
MALEEVKPELRAFHCGDLPLYERPTWGAQQWIGLNDPVHYL